MNWITGLLLAVVGAIVVGCSNGEVTSGNVASSITETPASQEQSDKGLGLDTGDSMALVAAQEVVLSGIYYSVLPSVVHIRVSQRVSEQSVESPFPFPFGFGQEPREFYRQGEGSGFVWDSDGNIVTNFHVVQEASRVTVLFSDGTEVEAEVLGSDPDSDLAVLKVEKLPARAVPAKPGDSDAVHVGELAVAIGNPFGQEFTMTTGIISAIGRTIPSGVSTFSIPNVIQTDAPINPGNSGGPLLNRNGEIIGINTQIASTNRASAGVGFAVPINTAKKVVPYLITESKYDYPWLGISGTTLTAEVADLMDLPEDSRGALIVDVTKGGPADEAGLKGSDKTVTIDGQQFPLGGDILIAIDDSVVHKMDDLIAYLMEHTRPGDQVSVDILREEGVSEVTVILGTRPRADES